jgi:hypothetical protein
MTNAEQRARHAEEQQRYRKRHPDRVSASIAKWKRKNIERVRATDAKWRRKNIERVREFNRVHRAANHQQYLAHIAVANATRRGTLLRLPCVVCGDTKTQGHHHAGYARENYRNVTWLCRFHHLQAHGRKRK